MIIQTYKNISIRQDSKKEDLKPYYMSNNIFIYWNTKGVPKKKHRHLHILSISLSLLKKGTHTIT